MNLDTERTHETHSLYIENTRGSKNILKRFLKSLKSIPSVFRNIPKYFRNIKAFNISIKNSIYISLCTSRMFHIYVPQNFNFSRNYESVFKQNFEKHTFEPNFGAYFISKMLRSLYSLLNDSY